MAKSSSHDGEEGATSQESQSLLRPDRSPTVVASSRQPCCHSTPDHQVLEHPRSRCGNRSKQRLLGPVVSWSHIPPQPSFYPTSFRHGTTGSDSPTSRCNHSTTNGSDSPTSRINFIVNGSDSPTSRTNFIVNGLDSPTSCNDRSTNGSDSPTSPINSADPSIRTDPRPQRLEISGSRLRVQEIIRSEI